MDARLEVIGARCHFCQRQDYLPLTCRRCLHAFCTAHATEAAHGCDAAGELSLSSSSTGTETAARTEVATPAGPSLRALQAEHLARRATPAAAGAPARPPARRELDAPALGALRKLAASLASKTSALTSGKTTSGTTTGGDGAARTGGRGQGTSAAARIKAIARLKATAKGDERVPVGRRRYLSVAVHHDGDPEPATWLPVYLDAAWSNGRALDWVAARLGVVNENARTQDESRRLHLLADGLVLEPSQVFGRSVGEDGARVRLFRGTRPMVE